PLVVFPTAANVNEGTPAGTPGGCHPAPAPAPPPARPTAATTRQAARRQGLRLPKQPGLAPPTAHHPAHCPTRHRVQRETGALSMGSRTHLRLAAPQPPVAGPLRTRRCPPPSLPLAGCRPHLLAVAPPPF